MRVILVLLGIAALVALAGIMTGFINIDQTRTAQLPHLEGGQAPKFRADVGRIDVGTEKKTIDVPHVTVQKPADNSTAPQ
ncbi:MAG: hypothetical protein BGO24_12830 [Sphingomonas sp. 67-36]|uniref:hypothetical protein n=2 Tax=unclassified Sphingomonas TaxID=196159 RepID=UPI000929EC4A|nr:hypothetical protein [Sphingomonas sp.]MBN8849058.1 hypothetical protein [Sphingomonas sp.]MBS0284986.1 hypothetical protein [Pseudomonadota bacterium]OJV34547.1 MAG: hypothetical protein BGO24_12830 [Sphingomonas sp. 67-36]